MNEPTAYVNNVELVIRGGQVAANWGTGMDWGASNAPGVGVASDNAGLQESLPSWTLLDQDGAARTPQVSQIIGGGGPAGMEGKGLEPVEFIANGDGDGTNTNPTVVSAHLVTLEAGWVAVVAP